MWYGIYTMSPGAGIPSVALALRKKGLLDHLNNLTPAGKAAAEKVNKK
jgi:hypothetical protein